MLKNKSAFKQIIKKQILVIHKICIFSYYKTYRMKRKQGTYIIEIASSLWSFKFISS